MHFEDAFQQAWHAFVLVTGLLLVGLVAHADGLFARAGALLERLPGGPPLLVLSHASISGGEFARSMFAPALVATLTTALGLLLLFRRRLGTPSPPSAQPLAHPRALLLGLNLGPNFAVTGSLSAYLWLKVSSQLGTRASARVFARRGVLLAPLALVGALLAASLLGAPS